MSRTDSVLDKIIATKRTEVARAREEVPERELQARLVDLPPIRDFFGALAAPGPIKLIAEVKKASPSAGLIRADFDPVRIATDYAENGAACISCLTDETYFQGNLEYLSAIRRSVDIPLLRKDFIIDSYQLLEARVAGADAVLLIAECLNDDELQTLHQQAIALELTPLVEFYAPQNCSRVLNAGARLVGVNNRNLHTFETDLQHTISMRKNIPAECLVVAESGIHTPADVRMLSQSGIDAMLVGESLMRQDSISMAVKNLLSGHFVDEE